MDRTRIGAALLLFILPAGLSAQAPQEPAASPSPQPALGAATLEKIARMTPLFDGTTLDGWLQAPPYTCSVSGDDVKDLPSLAKKLVDKADPVSAFIGSGLDEAQRAALTALTAESPDLRAVKGTLVKALNAVVSGPSLYEKDRFKGVALRPETEDLRRTDPQGLALARLNRLLLEDAYPAELLRSPASAWTVAGGAMSSLGAGRGVLYTAGDYGSFRLIFTMRHVGGPPSDHQACVLVFCTRPPEGEKGLDALGGIQFQPPSGGSWDYRPGKNNSGKELFTRVPRPKLDAHEWSQIELLVNAEKGTARMAVAQPVGTRAVEVLSFLDPTAGKKSPIAWQMHNTGLFDEYKDVRIEENPKEDRLITVE